MRNKSLGNSGEEAVALKLSEAGYEILGRNVHVGHYEIDLIVRNDERLAFVEVKTRRMALSPFGGTPADAVDEKKRERLLAAARTYLYLHPELAGERELGIDVAEVRADPNSGVFRALDITIYENAVR